MPPVPNSPDQIDLAVQLGRLRLPNPILVASGTFGYAREMEGLVDLRRLGGILPKTITQEARPGNAPWRTIETAAGMLNSIGLDNDGIEAFVAHHMPYLVGLGVPIIVSIAGRTHEEFVRMTARLDGLEGIQIQQQTNEPGFPRSAVDAAVTDIATVLENHVRSGKQANDGTLLDTALATLDRDGRVAQQLFEALAAALTEADLAAIAGNIASRL